LIESLLMSVGASQAAFAANSFVTGCLVLARIERVCINYAHVTVCMGTVPCYWASERLLNRKSAAGCLKGSVEKNESRLRSVPWFRWSRDVYHHVASLVFAVCSRPLL